MTAVRFLTRTAADYVLLGLAFCEAIVDLATIAVEPYGTDARTIVKEEK